MVRLREEQWSRMVELRDRSSNVVSFERYRQQQAQRLIEPTNPLKPVRLSLLSVGALCNPQPVVARLLPLAGWALLLPVVARLLLFVARWLPHMIICHMRRVIGDDHLAT
jgi:hypothetical protein